jgi:hypothetical protein
MSAEERAALIASSRWACPECASRNVQIALPHWCRETRGSAPDRVGELHPIGYDEDADPLWWICGDCEAAGQGKPDEVLP